MVCAKTWKNHRQGSGNTNHVLTTLGELDQSEVQLEPMVQIHPRPQKFSAADLAAFMRAAAKGKHKPVNSAKETDATGCLSMAAYT